MKVSHLLAAVAILGMVSFAVAAKGEKGGKGKGPKGVRGKVVTVVTDAETKAVTGLTIQTGSKKESKEVNVTTDASTTVKIDGKDAALTDLTAGMMVSITSNEAGTATKIMARTAKAKGEKGDKGKGKGKKKGKNKGDAA